jgi:ABC-type phosphate/phosphonate transport system substrate-binding protein
MLASLPMYDLPEVKPDTDALWQSIARNLGIAGMPLLRLADWSVPWHDPTLLFSQTCGYPFTHAFRDKLTYVATPHYRADGCDGPLYRSLIFARETRPLEDFRNSRAAYNSPDSMSGMLALKLVFAPLAKSGHFFASVLETGSHAASLAAVQSGRADICAIDCVTVALLRRHRPQALDLLHEVARSPAVPGLPFVTRSGNVDALRAALGLALVDPGISAARDRLLLAGTSVLQTSAYDTITNYEARLLHEGDLNLTPPHS